MACGSRPAFAGVIHNCSSTTGSVPGQRVSSGVGKETIVALAGADIERKIAQNTDDIFELYSISKDIQTTVRSHTKRLDRLDERLDGIDGRLDGIDGRLDRIDGRLDRIDGRLDGIDGRLDGIDGRFDRIETKIDSLGSTIEELVRRLAS